MHRRQKKIRQKKNKMGSNCSKNYNSKISNTITDNNLINNLTVKGLLVSNTFPTHKYKQQTTPDQDFDKSCMWCIINIEDNCVKELYVDKWCLGSECHSMNQLRNSKNYCYLYKYKANNQILEKQPYNMEDDVERKYEWLSRSIFIDLYDLDIINLQQKGWILGDHSKIFKSNLSQECFYYLFKNKDIV